MVVTVQAAPLVDGAAKGELLKLQAPICFWGGIDAVTGRISDPKHPDFRAGVTEKILAVPRIVGSSSSSQLLLELIYKKTSPAAIILGEADAIIAMAVMVGQEMGFGTIPILHRPLDDLETGMQLEIHTGGRVAFLA